MTIQVTTPIDIYPTSFEINGIVYETMCEYLSTYSSKKKKLIFIRSKCHTLNDGNVLQYMWGEALITTTYLINRWSFKILDKKFLI